jgi:hypothetical protein
MPIVTLDPDLLPVLFECSLHAAKDELSGIGVLEGELFPCGVRGSVVVPAEATVRCQPGPSLVSKCRCPLSKMGSANEPTSPSFP